MSYLKFPDTKSMDAWKIADAFLQSEQKYVNEALRPLFEIQNRLKIHINFKQEVIPESDINAIFQNSDSIYRFNTGLLSELMNARWKGGDEFLTQLPVIFHKNMSFFKLYSTYILNVKKTALKTLNNISSEDKDFKTFVMLNESCYEKDMISLILSPTNRLPLYTRYIAAIVEKLPSGHHAMSALHQTFLDLQGVMDQISNTFENFNRKSRVIEIQESTFKGSVILVDPTRKFFRTGNLKIREGSRFNQHQFFLFSDVLLYANSGLFGGMSIKNVMPLAGAKIVPNASVPTNFRISCGLIPREWDIMVEGDGKDSAEKLCAKWLTEIRAAYQEYHNDSGIKGQTTVLHPDDLDKVIHKKTLSNPRTFPKPKGQPLDDIIAHIAKLTGKRSAPKRSVPPTPSNASNNAPHIPSRPAPSLPPRTPTSQTQPPLTLMDLPAIVGDWERLFDESSNSTYYENLIEESTQWSPPPVVVDYLEACINARKSGQPLPPVPPTSKPITDYVYEPVQSAQPVPPVQPVQPTQSVAPPEHVVPPIPAVAVLAAAPAAPQLSMPPPKPTIEVPSIPETHTTSTLPPPNPLLAAIQGGATLNKVDTSQSSAPPKNDFLSAIRGGAQLKKVEEHEHEKTPSPGSGGFLSAIQGGIQLRKVEVSDEPKPSQDNGMISGNMADALQKSLANYRKFVQDDSDDDDDDDEW